MKVRELIDKLITMPPELEVTTCSISDTLAHPVLSGVGRDRLILGYDADGKPDTKDVVYMLHGDYDWVEYKR